MNWIKEYKKYVSDNPNGYWFKRKIYGWGWTPVTWQGWLVTLAIIGVLIWNALRIDATADSAGDVLFNVIPQTAVLVLLLIAIAWRTGESPKWMWGLPKKKDEDERV